MSIQAYAYVLEQVTGIPPQGKAVLAAIANHADAHGLGAYAGHKRIAHEAGFQGKYPERSVVRWVARLVDLGVLISYRRGRAGGTGRATNGYALPGMLPGVPTDRIVELSRVAEDDPDRAAKLAHEALIAAVHTHPEPVDNRPQEDSLSPSAQTSRGQLEHLKVTTVAPQSDNGVTGTVLNRPEPSSSTPPDGEPVDDHDRQEEEEVVDDLLDRVTAVRADLAHRHTRQSRRRLASALTGPLDDGWTVAQLADRLVGAGPLDDVRDLAAVLAARAADITGPPPAAVKVVLGDPACPTCAGTGRAWFYDDDRRADFHPCACLDREEDAA